MIGTFICGWFGGWYFTEPIVITKGENTYRAEWDAEVEKLKQAKAELETERQKLACERAGGNIKNYEAYVDFDKKEVWSTQCTTPNGVYYWNGDEFTREESL